MSTGISASVDDQSCFKGVALQYILYSDLRPRSRRKSKVKVGFLVGQKSSIGVLVHTTINTFRDSCVNGNFPKIY